MFSKLISNSFASGVLRRLVILGVLVSGSVSTGNANDGPHPVGPAFAGGVPDAFFLATVHCGWVCVSGSAGDDSVTRGFDALSNGLLPGDGSGGQGSPWGSLTGTLETWSRMVCLESAATRCGGLEKVGQSDLEKITSGSWVLNRRVYCPDSREADKIDRNGRNPAVVYPDYKPILSPFSSESGAIRKRDIGLETENALPVPELGAVLTGPESNPTLRRVDRFEYWMDRAVTFLEVPDSLITTADITHYLLDSTSTRTEEEYVVLMKTQHGIGPASPCATVIRGRACYGDCLEFPDGGDLEQYMATNKLGLDNVGPFSVCGDQLASFFEGHPMSASVKEIYCENYLMESLVAGRATAFTCSSYRIRADCTSVY